MNFEIKAKKLSLNKESIQNLSDSTMRQANGGIGITITTFVIATYLLRPTGRLMCPFKD